jgi:3'(2'), 5'-bisphosphate nucleotidase
MTVDDRSLALRLAEKAGELLLEVRRRLDAGEDPQSVRDRGDQMSHDLITSVLHNERPDDAVLSEEGVDDPVRLEADRVWIIDPLDGTREFGEPGRTDWAVHVALWERGELTVGAVALPAEGEVLTSADPPTIPSTDRPPRLIVSRTRPPKVALQLCEALDGEMVEMGSAGAKAMAVLRGQADVYAHAGGQYEWDSAAPVAVARAAGAHTSRIDGSPLRYNNADPSLPDLLICRPELAERALKALDAVSE